MAAARQGALARASAPLARRARALPPAVREPLYRLRDVWLYRRALRLYGGHGRLRSWRAAARGVLRPRRTVLFYPGRPPFAAVEYLYCALLGYGVTSDPGRPHAAAFKRADVTVFDPGLLAPLAGEPGPILNERSLDIGKRACARAFGEVFGYELAVDPLTHEGPLVEKADRNYAKDGRLLSGPLAPEDVRPDASYQRFLEGRTTPEGPIVEYRVPIMGDEIPLLYVKHRAEDARFTTTDSLWLVEPLDELTQDELDLLLAYARHVGLDYGEYDALRDAEGRLYVVDVNNTPSGPLTGQTRACAQEAYAVLKDAFARLVERAAAR